MDFFWRFPLSFFHLFIYFFPSLSISAITSIMQCNFLSLSFYLQSPRYCYSFILIILFFITLLRYPHNTLTLFSSYHFLTLYFYHTIIFHSFLRLLIFPINLNISTRAIFHSSFSSSWFPCSSSSGCLFSASVSSSVLS